MSRDGRRGWTLLLLREGDPRSHRVHLSRPAVLLPVLGVLAACAVVGVAVGRLWEGATAGARVAELESELARLEEERGRVGELAARLEAMEASYLRIRRAMGGEVARSERDVVLPPLGTWEAAAPGQEGEEARDRAWAWPLAERGFVTRSFGSGPDAAPGGHPGLDVAVPVGSYVRAAAPGLVSAAGRDSVYGFFVRIAHRDGLSSLYAHNSWIFVAAGDTVERLQVIALSGSTGRSTAPHLHFEVERDGETVDPLRLVSVGR